MTLLELANVMESTTFAKRVKAAILWHCNAIIKEDPATPDHAERVAWMRRAVGGVNYMADQLIPALLAHNEIIAAGELITDAKLVAAIGDLLLYF